MTGTRVRKTAGPQATPPWVIYLVGGAQQPSPSQLTAVMAIRLTISVTLLW